MARRVRKGEYSFVRVVKGEKAGRIGFYADDHGTDAEVYFNTCIEDVEYPVPRPAWIPRKDLRRANVLPFFLGNVAADLPRSDGRHDGTDGRERFIPAASAEETPRTPCPSRRIWAGARREGRTQGPCGIL